VTTEIQRVDDPLPHEHFTGAPGVGGMIKICPEDFLVDEIPLYDPCGEGEHLYIGVQKTGVSHVEMLSHIRRHFKVRERDIGFAGMKDRRAVTRQQISIRLGEEPTDLSLGHERIQILWARRHTNKLRRGHLAGNRFVIRIREVDPLKVPRVRQGLVHLERTGVPNYFGSQRFGYRRNNHRIGAWLLTRQWQQILDELLGTRGSESPDHQRERRALYDEGRFDEAAELWTPADRAEFIAITSLRNGADPPRAVRAIGRAALSFWISAFQSAIFNRVLDERLRAGALERLEVGDLAWKHGSRRVFRVTPEEIATDLLPDRLARLEISPSGPLWGEGLMQATDAVGKAERDALDDSGITLEQLLESGDCPPGGRRSLRGLLRNPDVESGTDETGPYIRVAFDLSRGSYATVVLREFMKTDASAGAAPDVKPGSDPR
jgi:tRNA pseudouridine13 synthase